MQSAVFRRAPCRSIRLSRGIDRIHAVEAIGLSYLGCMLPGMSGPELQRRLAEDRNIVAVVFITANLDQSVRKRALERGATGFFHEPIHSDAFLKTLRATLS
jgi:FixJ family two-component response regulator